jgi:hypothetical protein
VAFSEAQMAAPMIAAITIGQNATRGPAMRLPRSARKPRTPRRSSSRRPKKPAIRKKVVMRKMCRTKNRPDSAGVVSTSRTGQTWKPGMNDIVR